MAAPEALWLFEDIMRPYTPQDKKIIDNLKGKAVLIINSRFPNVWSSFDELGVQGGVVKINSERFNLAIEFLLHCLGEFDKLFGKWSSQPQGHSASCKALIRLSASLKS